MAPSFAYVYDVFTQDPKFDRDLARIETEIARLGIQGRTVRLALFRDLEDGLKDCLATGVKNVIFIGGDELIFQALPFLVQTGLVGGFIPLRSSRLAGPFGIPMGADAVGIIAARVLTVIDVGLLNDHPFLTEAVVLNTTASIKLDDAYTIRALQPGSLSIRNIAVETAGGIGECVSGDGKLEVVLQTKTQIPAYFGLWKQTKLEETRLFFEQASMDAGDGVEFLVDGQRFTTKKAIFRLKPNAFSLIVGPDRKV